MVKYVKTTVVLQPDLYHQLTDEAKNEYGSVRKMSEALNRILARHFLKKQELFGISKPFDTPFVRDKNDREF